MIQTEISKIIGPLLEDMGYELWGCEFIQGHSGLLRIYIDKEGGVNITDCERVSLRVGALLDVEDPFRGNYRLEVSSPGIPRPLFYPKQYAEYVGSQVQIRLFTAIQNKRKLSGELLSISDLGIKLRVEQELLEIPFAQIMKAMVLSE